MRSQTAVRTPSEEARAHIHKVVEGIQRSERDENILVAHHLVSKGEKVQESEEKPIYNCQGNGKEGKEEGIKKKKAKRKEEPTFGWQRGGQKDEAEKKSVVNSVKKGKRM